MTARPWTDWIPGVLSKRQVLSLCEQGYLTGVPDLRNDIDHSSVDVHLANKAYRLTQGSVKPWGGSYLHFLTQYELAVPLQPDADARFTLEPKNTYLFPLKERLERLRGSNIYGQATAKSSIGRVDVLARLIVDGMDSYEGFDLAGLDQSTGELFLELTPMTFPVQVTEGDSLSQLRFFLGPPEAAIVPGEAVASTLLPNSDRSDGTITVDLTDTKVSDHPVAAFCAKEGDLPNQPIDLSADSPNKPEPSRFWKFLSADKHKRLKITTSAFYLLRSRELLSIPKGIAIYCRAIDETIGEMRIHYAGFVHPFFGKGRPDGADGTPLTFEVRGHDVDVSLNHGEKMARLTFYRMSEDANDVAEGDPSPYNEQTLELSNRFGPWPEKIKVHKDGTVEPV